MLEYIYDLNKEINGILRGMNGGESGFAVAEKLENQHKSKSSKGPEREEVYFSKYPLGLGFID